VAPANYLTNVQPTSAPLTVQVANNQTMQSTHTATLTLPGLPPAATQAHIFPHMDKSLVAAGPLCDAGCTIFLHQHGGTIQGPNMAPIIVERQHNGLWTIASPNPTITPGATANAAIHPSNHNTPADLVAFYHAALWSPTLATLKAAMQKQYLPPLPGLSLTTLKKYPPSLEATVMGHLDNRRKNTQSTKRPPHREATSPAALMAEQEDFYPPSEAPNTRTHLCYIAASEPKHIVYSDQTGRLPYASTMGNQYVLVAYDHDSNFIFMRPIKSRKSQHLLEAIQDIYKILARSGFQPKFHRLDNECPQEVKDYFTDNGVQYQLAPPEDHRSNAAERAIRTAKNHLAAGWYSTDEKFPMYLWDKTIPHAELTLNLLRGSRVAPQLSAWEQIHGRFDFNLHPIAPPGIKVMAHLKPGTRESWSPHAIEAWYVGPALHHHRCHMVCAQQSGAT
jgi:hypothetical protein